MVFAVLAERGEWVTLTVGEAVTGAEVSLFELLPLLPALAALAMSKLANMALEMKMTVKSFMIFGEKR